MTGEGRPFTDGYQATLSRPREGEEDPETLLLVIRSPSWQGGSVILDTLKYLKISYQHSGKIKRSKRPTVLCKIYFIL